MTLSAPADSPPIGIDLYQDVYRFAYSLSFNEADARDLTQQTYMKLSTHGHAIQDASKVKSWLFTTLHREFLHLRRRVVRFPQTTLDEAGIADLPSDASPEPGTDTSAVMHALSQLDEKLRAPLALFYLKDMRYREIAEILDVPIGTVMSRLTRAKQALRRALGIEDPTTPTFGALAI